MSDPARELDDAALLKAFESCRVARAHWNHRAHVRVAWMYLRSGTLPEALARMRAGLEALNRSHRVPEGLLDRGYHETLTVAFLTLIAATMRSVGPSQDSRGFCDDNPHLLARTVTRLYYTRGRIMSFDAKRAFVPPDLAPLPWPLAELPSPLAEISSPLVPAPAVATPPIDA